MFYATRGVHWCNKKNHDENRGVNHSQLMLPFKTCIRKAREPSGWRDRKFEIARVARAQTGHTSGCTHRQITAWQTLQADPHTLEYEILRECHNGAVLRLHPDLPRAHRSPPACSVFRDAPAPLPPAIIGRADLRQAAVAGRSAPTGRASAFASTCGD